MMRQGIAIKGIPKGLFRVLNRLIFSWSSPNRSCDKKTTNLTENVNEREKAQAQVLFVDSTKLFDQKERMVGKILVAPSSEKLILEMARALRVDKNGLLQVAEKVDPEASEYVIHEPRAADFLRMAKEQEFGNGDWEKLSQLGKTTGLGKQEQEKK